MRGEGDDGPGLEPFSYAGVWAGRRRPEVIRRNPSLQEQLEVVLPLTLYFSRSWIAVPNVRERQLPWLGGHV